MVSLISILLTAGQIVGSKHKSPKFMFWAFVDVVIFVSVFIITVVSMAYGFESMGFGFIATVHLRNAQMVAWTGILIKPLYLVDVFVTEKKFLKLFMQVIFRLLVTSIIVCTIAIVPLGFLYLVSKSAVDDKELQ